MAVSYELRIHNRAGVLQALVTNFLSLHYSKVVNDHGICFFGLSGQHDAIQYLEKDGQIEVWRADPSHGIDPYCDFYGLYRTRDRRTPTGNPRGIFTAKCVGQKHFLKRAIVAWPAATANRNDFTSDPAETILKLLVTYNATSAATTANGRIRTVGTWANNITVQADGATGDTKSIACAHRVLLDVLQQVAAVGGLDFDLVKTAAQSWQFRTVLKDADDQRANVIFALDWGNMDNPQITDDALDEPTVAIAGGEGVEIDREFAVRTGANYVAGYNDYEMFVHAVMQQTTPGLEAAADARLNEVRARADLTFDIKQTVQYRYGRDYEVGTIVTVNYETPVVKKIRSVSVDVTTSAGSQQAEKISAEMVDYA